MVAKLQRRSHSDGTSGGFHSWQQAAFVAGSRLPYSCSKFYFLSNIPKGLQLELPLVAVNALVDGKVGIGCQSCVFLLMDGLR